MSDLYKAFAELESASPEERARLLDSIEDGQTRARLEKLLASSESAGDFLATPAVERADLDELADPTDGSSAGDGPDPWLGRELGAYRLTHRIGAGGTSTVYAAERSDRQFDKRVAVKILSRNVDTTDLAKRLRTERQVLAGLEHPHIARLLDGGEAPGGLPYIVMEYVDGEAIDVHCDRERLPVEARVRLYLDVCDAVEHAHAAGVIHRDLKPSNVLVDGAGVVKLLDFGIAKQRLSPGKETATGSAMMTPHYASPEQLRNATVTPATDVYSLGVMLYELFTGQLPFPMDRGGIADWIERVCNRDAPRPSESAASATQKQLAERAADGATLARRLRGDLDTIAMKALEKDPPRRYVSPRALRDDLERFLDGRPVLARGRSLTYRLRKWVARNRVPAASAGAALVALVGAATLSANQFLRVASLGLLAATVIVTVFLYVRADRLRRRAQRYRAASDLERRRAQEVSTFLKKMLTSITPDVAQGKDTALLRTVLEESAGRIGAEFTDQPDVAADMHVTVGSVYKAIVSYDEARAHFDRAAELITRESHPDIYLDLVQARADLATKEGRYEEAVQILDDAAALLEDVAAGRRVSIHVLRAYALQMAGRLDEAGPVLRETIRQATTTPGVDETAIADAWQHLGVFERQHGSMDEAEHALRESVRLHEIVREREGTVHHTTIALNALHSLARLLSMRRKLKESEKLYLDLIEEAKVVLGERDPTYSIYLIGLAMLCELEERWEDAERLHRRALEIQIESLGEGHVHVATSYNNLAYLYQRTDRLKESDDEYVNARRAYVEALGERHPWVFNVDLNHALTLIALGDRVRAEQALDSASAPETERAGQAVNQIYTYLRALLDIDQGSTDGAVAVVQRDIGELEGRFGPNHPLVRLGRERLERSATS